VSNSHKEKSSNYEPKQLEEEDDAESENKDTAAVRKLKYAEKLLQVCKQCVATVTVLNKSDPNWESDFAESVT
jgi:hypothetical protein